MTERSAEPFRAFGNPAQQRMQIAAHHLWPLLKDEPKYAYGGRMIGIDGANKFDLDAIEALTRVQGASVSHYIPLSEEDGLTGALQERSLTTDRWDQFMSTENCLEDCRRFVESFEIPEGYECIKVDTTTSDAVFDSFSETALSCGVLPPISTALVGRSRKGVCFLFRAPDGGVAACSGAILSNHVESRFGTSSWWGMLATRDTDRGHSLSLYLGAKAVLFMNDKFGVTEFYTGVRKDNDVSRHVCRKLGITESGYCCLATLDPDFFGDGGYTK